jgi:hypothetical protein
MADLFDRTETFDTLANDAADLQDFIRRSVGGKDSA